MLRTNLNYYGEYKDRVAETERVKEETRARVEGGVGDVPVVPGSAEQMAD